MEQEAEYSGPTDFVHLHCHTSFSILDGIALPSQYFEESAARGWKAVAITEHGNLASVPDSYFAAKKNKVKYIPACEVYYNDYELTRQQMAADGAKLSELKLNNLDLYERIMRNRHITVYAKNATGFANLVKLTTEAWDDGFYRKPRVWYDKLDKYRGGLVVASGCLNGPISYELLRKNVTKAKEYIEKFREIFGEDFYLEAQMPCLIDKPDYAVFWWIVNAGKKFNIHTVLTNDSHYLSQRDFEIQKLMMAIEQETTIDDPNLFHVNSDEQYFKTRAELYHTFKTKKYCEHVTDSDFEVICDNTIRLAETCENFSPDLSPKVPVIEDADNKLKRKVLSELKKRGLLQCDKKFFMDNREVTYLEQAKIELQRVIDKGFSSYFLITADIVEYSVQNGWPIGPRGSAGGSLINYLLGISDINPLLWSGLSFNRFLSPTRGGDILNIKAE